MYRACFVLAPVSAPLSRCFLMMCVTIFVWFDGTVWAFDLAGTALPTDEHEARLMVEANELDSALWLLLEPFYHRPLQVPTGELRWLYDIFPSFADQLPTHPEILDQYLPWSEGSVKRFLSDYPIAANCFPILRFDYHAQRTVGTCSFFVYPGTDEARHSVKYSLTPHDKLQFDGLVDVSDYAARFERRALSFSPSPALTIQAGNVPFVRDRGLHFGRFPVDKRSYTDASLNVLTGTHPDWNGVRATFSAPSLHSAVAPSLSVFYHNRSTESLGGATVQLKAGKRFNAELGGVHVSTSSNLYNVYKDTILTGNMQFSTQNFTSTLYSGFATKSEGGVPFIWENRFRSNKRVVTLTATHFPVLIDNEYSLLQERFKNEMDAIDDGIPTGSVTLLQMHSFSSSGSTSGLQPSAELWFSGSLVHHADMVLTWFRKVEPLSTSVAVTSRFNNDATYPAGFTIARVDGNSNWTFKQAAVLSSRHVLAFSNSYYKYYRATVSPVFSTFAGGVIEPLLIGTVRRGYEPELLFGCRHRQTLFKRTFSEVYIEKRPATSTDKGSFHVEAMATFMF